MMASNATRTIVEMWICLMLATVLILLRVGLRKLRRQPLTQGDYWCLLAGVFIITLLITNHLLLLYGSTRTLTSEQRIALSAPDADPSRVIAGSKIILVTRSMLVCILWSLKMAVLDLLVRLISKMPHERLILYSYRTILGTTWVVSLISVFIGCRPFDVYWRIYSDPGSCIIGNLWLLTYEISNIITDAMLMALPFPLLLSVKIALAQRLRICFLFSIGIFLIAISILSILQGLNSRVQRSHTLWASLELLLAVVVAVTPTIYALALNYREGSSYDTNPTSTMCRTTHTMPRPSVDNVKYSAQAWTELQDRPKGAAVEESSIDGILVETSIETRKQSVVMDSNSISSDGGGRY